MITKYMQKGAAITALRQGGWVELGHWGRMAAVETVEEVPASAMLLMPAIPPHAEEGRRIANSHILASPSQPLSLISLRQFPETVPPFEFVDPSESDRKILSAAVALLKASALLPVALIERGSHLPATLSLPEAVVDNLIESGPGVWREVTRAPIPLPQGMANMVAFRPADGGLEQILLIFGNPRPEGAPLVRLHSQCFTGDVLHSQRCDCGEQLEGALERLAQEKEGGILIYLTQEGRGIGLTNKLRAYRLQDQGLDTLDANLRLGFGADEREYAAAAALLKAMGFMRITLLSNNPAKAEALRAQGIEVVGMARHAFPANRHNRSYLATKAKRFGHLF